ncbi:MAG: nuclear transport factor 2 family protein [Acidimicrobiales bacterium]
MTTSPLADRQRISDAGADDVIAAHLEQLDRGVPAGAAAARALAASDVDWRSIRAEILASPRAIILAQRDDGPALAARFFDPATPTTIHDHGTAGAALVVEGREHYERFEPTGDTTARLESIYHLALGDVVWWQGPPEDIHRQTGLGDGSIGLVLLACEPESVTNFTDATEPASALRAALLTGFLAGDITPLAPWYDDHVLLDANVPEWRFQVRGRDDVLAGLEHEEFAKPDRRLAFLRATDTTAGLLVETEARFTDEGAARRCREAHHLRVRDGRIVEHVIWCTGISDADTAHRQFTTAPMERM